ncbi:hypothetical protein FBUS_05633 [Fasciolopsis buskii]|uniref:Uncharacterized protein n=1 Tax=Fasciolopsis buskii TaxID=27845 RepID=A0A8E0S5C8_9TREM|nr:hypothetical protein FBUS_05633 [Fasciolopsis buski]
MVWLVCVTFSEKNDKNPLPWDLGDEIQTAENEEGLDIHDVGEKIDGRIHGNLYKWLNAKPIRDVPPVDPLAGYRYPELGGDSFVPPPIKDHMLFYKCYSCTQCDDEDRSDYHIETNCTECGVS